MSICCAFSFSLIFLLFYFFPLVLFSLGWGGGSVCWRSDLFLKAFTREAGVLLLMQFLYICRSVPVAGDGPVPLSSWHSVSRCALHS